MMYLNGALNSNRDRVTSLIKRALRSLPFSFSFSLMTGAQIDAAYPVRANVPAFSGAVISCTILPQLSSVSRAPWSPLTASIGVMVLVPLSNGCSMWVGGKDISRQGNTLFETTNSYFNTDTQSPVVLGSMVFGLGANNAYQVITYTA